MPYDFPIRFGKYYLTRRIAVGGMAEVFKAKLMGIKGFEKTLAVKKILPEFNEDEDFVGMFVDEARISSNLHHNNIVQVFDFGRVENSYYIAMEYIDGTNVKSLLQRQLKTVGPFPRREAYYLIMQIARALDYAHNVQVDGHEVLDLVHRDVSPQNVLVARTGEVKITDFGIAKAAIRLSKTQPGKIQGKFSYMSPEQASGKKLDRRSDIFSLGIIAYELLSGIKAYGAEDTAQKYKEVREAYIQRLATLVPDLPSEVESLVMQMLSREPKDRPQTCAEIAQKFGDFLSDISTSQLSHELGQLVETLFPKEKSDPTISQRLRDYAEQEPVEPLTSQKSIFIPEPQKPKVTTLVLRAESEEPTVSNWPFFLLHSKLGRIALISFLVSLLAILGYWIQTSKAPPPPPETTLLESLQLKGTPHSGPIDSDIHADAKAREEETNLKLDELEQRLKETEKELDTTTKKLHVAENVERPIIRPCLNDMVLIDTGTFLFGSDKKDPLRNDSVEYVETKMANKRFCVDRFEYPNRKGVIPQSKNWLDAQTSCFKEGKRLCTQEEWERSCKGGSPTTNRRYPYGNTWDPKRCNTERIEKGTGDFIDRPIAKSGSFVNCVSPDGVFDLSGNLDEWTSTQGRYAQSSRVTKGGSSHSPDWATRCSALREVIGTTKEADLGFRCCKDAL